MKARTGLVCSLTALAALLVLHAPPALAAWRPVDYLYQCEDSNDYSGYVYVILEGEVDGVPVVIKRKAGWVSSCTTDGHVSLCADCYTAKDIKLQTLSYNFSVDGLATLDAWIVLDRVPGTPPGPAPTSWTQRAYCNTEWHHRLTEYPTPEGWPPAANFTLEWYSTARALDATPQKAESRSTYWDSHTFTSAGGLLHALSPWKKRPTTQWLHNAGVVHSALVVNCKLDYGSLRLEADHEVSTTGTPPCWGAEYQ